MPPSRRLPGSAAGSPPERAPVPPPPVVHAPGGMLPAGVGRNTPFAAHQADFGSNHAPSSAQSMRVMSIVLGLLFMLGAAALGAVMLLIVGLIGFGPKGAIEAVTGGKKKEHVRDTGLVEDIAIVRPRGPGKGPDGGPPEETDPMKLMFGGLGAAPITVIVNTTQKELYRQIEVLCPQVNFRQRADIVNDKAHIAIVPAARCHLVFQGNVPMKTWITGGDTLKCTSLQPIVCRKVN